MPHVGELAPDFTLDDQNGHPVALADLRGKTVILYFYPKADTPGCTVEAQGFAAAQPQYDAVDAMILGVSPDTCKAQLKFAEKFSLPFRLLADHEHKLAELYGIWVEKSMYGKKYMGVERTTFVIAPDGTISHIFSKVKVDGHANEVLKTLKAPTTA